MSACYCTGKCRELGYCPNTVRPLGPYWPTITPMPEPVGWTCPRCGAGVAPWQPSCPRCNPPFKITYHSTIE